MGLKGEKLAEKHLKKLGYKIIKTNYVTPFGEADIVCEKDGAIVFAEVKTRTSFNFGTPAQAVDYKKQKKYRQIASFYLNSNGLDDVEVSFMVVEVLDDNVNLITDAF
ncbi:MAG: YraN family protein [Clostridia bacterium]|nr:YraN family protein [Clostridia bacterium]